MSRISSALGIMVITVMSALFALPNAGQGQSFRDYCHERAQKLSGYRGRPNVVGGAIEGAIGGAIISGILGGNKRDRKKAAKIGALLGGVSAANRPNSRKARIYRLEYSDCMRRR